MLPKILGDLFRVSVRLLSVKHDSRGMTLRALRRHAELCRYFAPDVVYVVIPREVWYGTAEILRIDS